MKVILRLVLFIAVSVSVILVISCDKRITEPSYEPPTSGLSSDEFVVHRYHSFHGEVLDHGEVIQMKNFTEFERYFNFKYIVFCEEKQSWDTVDLKHNYDREFFVDRYLVNVGVWTAYTGPEPVAVYIDENGIISFVQIDHVDWSYGAAVTGWNILIELPKTFMPSGFSIKMSDVNAPCFEGKDCDCGYTESPPAVLKAGEFEVRIVSGYVKSRHDKVIPIKSSIEFERHPTIVQHSYYCFERETWIIDDLRQNYTSEFFENHYLVSFGLITSNTGVRFEITHIDQSGVIFVTRKEGFGGDAMGKIAFLLELPNSFDKEQFSIQVLNQSENYCLVIGCLCFKEQR
jgi:hypothetical protein